MKDIILPDDGDEGSWGRDPDLEARLVAWMMGEASEFEVESLERLVESRPEVREIKRRLEEIHGLVEGAVHSGVDEAWKLPPERRAHVMERLGIGNGGNGPSREPNGDGEGKEARIRRAGRKVLWAAAACLMINVILLVWLVGTMTASKSARSEAETREWVTMEMARDGSDSMVPRDSIEGFALEPPVTQSKAAPPAPGGGMPMPAPKSAEPAQDRAGEALAALRENLGEADRRTAMAGRKKSEGRQDFASDPRETDDDLADPFGGDDETEEESEVAEESKEGEIVAAEIPGSTSIPVPEVADLPSVDFGNGDQFGAGWGAGGEGGGGGFGGGGPAERPSLGDVPVTGRRFGNRPVRRQPEGEPPEGSPSRELGFVDDSAGAVANAQRLRRGGKYEEARESLELEYLDDPIRTNPALTFEHTQKVGQVRQKLYTAEGYENLGLHDEANREYQSVLRDDPNNTAARRGMEQVERLKSDHYRAAYDETRARMLAQVDQAWEMTVPPPVEEAGRPGRGRSGAPLAGSEGIEQKMKDIVIPELNLDDTTVDEAIELIRQKAEELDHGELDPKKKGINFVVRKPRLEETVDEELDAEAGLGAVDPGKARVKELKLKNVPVGQALQYIADQARLRYKVDEYAVTMLPLGSGEGDDILTRKWKVPPTLLSDLEGSSEGEPEADPFASEEGGLGGAALRPRRPLVDILKDAGIDFPPGASAQFIPSSGTLIVSNTPANLDLVDQLTEDTVAAVPSTVVDPKLFRRIDTTDTDKTAATWEKLHGIKVPEIDFEDVTVEEALSYFNRKLGEVRTPDGQPVGITLGVPGPFASSFDVETSAEDPGQARIAELKLRNVPLGTALYHVANQAGLELRVKDESVTLGPAGGGAQLVTRSWHLDPFVMEKFKEGYSLYDDDSDDPFGDELEAEQPSLPLPDRPLIEELMEVGIDFPPNSAVRYLPGTSTLIVTNTEANLDLVDQLFESVAYEMSQEEEHEEKIEETLEKSAAEEPFSTFSLHISDVSFKLAKATLARGEWPAAGQIRVEEFVNAFDYGDPAPRMEEKVACRLEEAAHPFMQERNLLRISMRTAALGRSGGTPLRLTVLLDNSGSMERMDRVESVQRAFDLLAGQLTGNDEVTLISFARSPRLLADRVSGDEAGTLSQLVASTPSEGGTNLESALRLGLEKAREGKVEGGQNRVILLTDGAANLGNANPEDLARLVEEMREEGIAFDACGVGAEGLNDEILESLTRKGDGRYYFLDRPEDADEGFAKQIAGALRPAAKNVKVQVHFNPRRVGRYKLFGFEKHRLEKEDFRDDSVDAAEMAAEEAGNAVYQVQVLPDGAGEIGAVSVRFRDTASGRMVERQWTIPYAGDAPRFGEAAPAIRLAASAAFLGEKLNGSPIGQRVRLKELAGMVSRLQAEFPKSERVTEFAVMTGQARELGE